MLNDNVNGTKDKFKEKEDNDKPSTNSPSYLIWSIFTKQREMEKAKFVKKRNHTSAGNSKISTNYLLYTAKKILLLKDILIINYPFLFC